MKQLRPTGCAMAALLMIATASPRCCAAVVVLSNHTADEVRFVLEDEGEERHHKLAPQEVRTWRISATTDLWFADDPESGYRLRGGGAYVFLHGSRTRRLELHRLGLLDEGAWLGEEPDSGDKPIASNSRGTVVQVHLVLDASATDDVESWERSLRAILSKASQVTSPQCGVAFEAVDFRLWQSDRATADFHAVWHEFVLAVPAEPGEVVVGFTTRALGDPTCLGFPNTAAPLTSHLLICAGGPLTSERERLQPLLHALGHYLGAAHSPETDSVMATALDRPSTDTEAVIRFDPINALAMASVGEELISAAPKSLAELSPRVRQRLASVYGTLAEAIPHDLVADRFSRLILIAPAKTPDDNEPEAWEPREPEAPPKQPAHIVPRDIANVATTASPAQRGPAQAADQAHSLLASVEQLGLDEERADDGSHGELERSALPQAVALALFLVAIPAGAFLWRLTDRDGTQREADGEELAPVPWQGMEAVDRTAWSVYLASVASVAMLGATSLFSNEAGGVKAAALLLSAVLAAMTVAPLYPMVGPLAYLVLSYAIQSDDPAGARIENSGVLMCLPVLSAAALGLRFFRQRRRPCPPRGIAVWIVLVMMAWIGLTAVGAAVSDLPVSSKMVHRLARFAHVLVLFLVTLYADVGLVELRLTSLVLALALFARVHFFRADVSMEQNLAMLAAIACPLLFAAGQTAPSKLAKAGFYLMSGYLFSLIVYAQNRAAMVALPVAAAILLLSSPHRKRALLIVAPLAVVLTVWLASSGRLNRFAEIRQEGDFQGSAYYRLRIWTAGVHMTRDHAALGVGPGNFELFVPRYDPDLPSIGPHNSFVQMVAETGLVGAVIYVLLILAASLQLVLTIRRHSDDWRGAVAGGVLASLTAHVVTGCFLENPSLAATYVVLAVGLAVATAPVTRVYRERLYLPLPDSVARPLAEFAVRCPRIVSGMPLARWLARPRQRTGEVIEAPFHSGRQSSAWWLRRLLVADLLLTTAGSLAPFSFRPMNPRAAVEFYCRQMSQTLEFADRSDWLANILLFVPIGFLAMAVFCPDRQSWRRLSASAFVVAGCLLFGGLVELAQVWFPSRTVNPNDVAAESLGAAAGAVGFLLFGNRLVALAAAAFARRNRLETSEKLLLCYAAGLIVYAAWPFDVTINPTDFASKLREGRIDFDGWGRPGWLGNVAMSAALMTPIGVLLRTLGLRRGATLRSWPALIMSGTGWLLGIELCRLLVFSQSVALAHLAGGLAGVLLGGLARQLAASR